MLSHPQAGVDTVATLKVLITTFTLELVFHNGKCPLPHKSFQQLSYITLRLAASILIAVQNLFGQWMVCVMKSPFRCFPV